VLSFNNAKAPLTNLKLRQAIRTAIDHKALMDTCWAGKGTLIGSMVPPTDPWYEDRTGDFPYDPAKAKALLAQAGLASGVNLTLTLPPYGYATQAGPLIQAYLKAVGINVTLKDIQWPLWISQVFTSKNFDMTIIDHVEARDITNYATPGYYWNYGKTAQVASLLNAGNAAPTQGQQVTKYADVLKMITGDAVNAWLYNPDAITVVKSGIVGLPTSGHSESFNLAYLASGGPVPAAATAQGFSS
jgi:peptide/nickel transport system substrate-binding protein